MLHCGLYLLGVSLKLGGDGGGVGWVLSGDEGGVGVDGD